MAKERTLVCIKIPRSDTNEGCEIEVTVTSQQQAQENRAMAKTELKQKAQRYQKPMLSVGGHKILRGCLSI